MFLDASDRLSSIKSDLLPYLIRRQLRGDGEAAAGASSVETAICQLTRLLALQHKA